MNLIQSIVFHLSFCSIWEPAPNPDVYSPRRVHRYENTQSAGEATTRLTLEQPPAPGTDVSSDERLLPCGPQAKHGRTKLNLASKCSHCCLLEGLHELAWPHQGKGGQGWPSACTSGGCRTWRLFGSEAKPNHGAWSRCCGGVYITDRTAVCPEGQLPHVSSRDTGMTPLSLQYVDSRVSWGLPAPRGEDPQPDGELTGIQPSAYSQKGNG